MKCQFGHTMERTIAGKLYCRRCKLNARGNDTSRKYHGVSSHRKRVDYLQQILMANGYSPRAARLLAKQLLPE
jgi:hypothetical protein